MSESIDPVAAAILGALQGITEFLPVSSSGHTAVAAALFGFGEAPLALTVMLHAGTLAATVWLFRSDLRALFSDLFHGLRSPSSFASSDSGRLLIAIVVAMIPTIVIALLLRDTVEAWSHRLPMVGLCFIGSAGAALVTRWQGGRQDEVGLPGALIVGIMQGLAVLPGLSRSGVTIAAAMTTGTGEEEAFRFSFLLSIPAVLAATIWELTKAGALASVGSAGWIGGLVAFGTGYVSLILLRRLLIAGRFWMFALYLLPLGLGLIFGGRVG